MIEQDGPKRMYGNAAKTQISFGVMPASSDGRDQSLHWPVGKRIEGDAFAGLRIKTNAAAGAKPRNGVGLDQTRRAQELPRSIYCLEPAHLKRHLKV